MIPTGDGSIEVASGRNYINLSAIFGLTLPANGDPPISRDAYNELASDYEGITNAAIREYYEWPAVRSLLLNLTGLRVLDAACGDGFYTERLLKRGATVVGIDASREMIAQAQDRFSEEDRVTVHQADLTEDLFEFNTEQFDLILCQLALEHIEDWDAVFTGFSRVLKSQGRVVISTSHPVRDYVDAEYPVREHILADSATYAEIERADRDWGNDTEDFVMPFYRRPLEALMRPGTDAGLLVEEVVEPDVTETFRNERPDLADEFHHGPPNFLCLRFVKATEIINNF